MARFKTRSSTFSPGSLLILCCLWAVVGCGKNTGPGRYDLSGKVTYDGRPVPLGSISFAPDKAHGNDGPGSSANIKNGVFQTRPNDGTIGGPHIVTISGFESPEGQQQVSPGNPIGKPLFTNIQLSVDLPKEDAVHDFVIPLSRK